MFATAVFRLAENEKKIKCAIHRTDKMWNMHKVDILYQQEYPI